MTTQITVPEEGLKLVVMAGRTSEGNPVWRQIGLIINSKKQKPMILVDKTFNPAGVMADHDAASVILHIFEFSAEEKKFKNNRKAAMSSAPRKSYTPFADMDDDIPF